jgi:hypothetical protein
MLSSALCNERDFSSAATLRRTHGDVSKLLRSLKEATTATSILDSEGYYQPNLGQIFASMEPYVPESDAQFHKLTLGGLPQVSPPAGRS